MDFSRRLLSVAGEDRRHGPCQAKVTGIREGAMVSQDPSICAAEKGNERAVVAMSALSQALARMDAIAILRLAQRNSVQVMAATPMPSRLKQPDCLVLNRLPFAVCLLLHAYPSFPGGPWKLLLVMSWSSAHPSFAICLLLGVYLPLAPLFLLHAQEHTPLHWWPHLRRPCGPVNSRRASHYCTLLDSSVSFVTRRAKAKIIWPSRYINFQDRSRLYRCGCTGVVFFIHSYTETLLCRSKLKDELVLRGWWSSRAQRPCHSWYQLPQELGPLFWPRDAKEE